MRPIFFIPFLFLTACSVQATPQAAPPTATAIPFATATLVPTFTPRPSLTAAIPTIAPTIAPISASLTAQVNVRVSPDKNATSLGLLDYGSLVQVIGKDASGDWWQIIYPQNSATTGWVAVAYVPVPEADVARLPVVMPSSNQSAQSPAASALETPTIAARTATVKAQIFVRAGPAQAFDSLGTVNAGTIVTPIGRNETNVWVQIQFEGGVDGKGWVAAAYLENADLQGLPYFDNQGKLVYAATPAANPGQPTLTATAFSAAIADGDSEKAPAVRLKFAPDAAREFTFSSELSAPSGDSTDWVAFTPYEPTNQSTFVFFKLECSGNGGITATLEKDGLPVPDLKPMVCGNYDLGMKVLGGQEYILVLNADGSGGPLRYVRYNLYIKSER